MASLCTTGAARLDLRAIEFEGSETFGVARSATYVDGLLRTLRLLADFPGMARLRRDIEPPVRVHRYGAHVIVYVPEGAGVLILRIRHGREDWQTDPVGGVSLNDLGDRS